MPVILNPLTGKFDFIGAPPPDGPTGGTGSAFQFNYIFSDDITNTDPTSGKVKVNNTGGLSTEMYISNFDADGVDRSALLSLLTSGDFVNVIDSGDLTNDFLFRATDSSTQNLDYLTIPVENLSFNGTLLNDANVTIGILFGGTGSITGNQDILDGAGAISLPDFSFNSTSVLSAIITISMTRLNDSESRTSKQELTLIWSGGDWVGGVTDQNEFGINNVGVVFGITNNAGTSEVTYNSDLMGGIYDQASSQFSYTILAVEL